MATLIQPDGTETDVQPRDGKRFKLDELQAFVGGYIEMVSNVGPDRRRFVLVVNDEGWVLDPPLAVNLKATNFYRAKWGFRPIADTTGVGPGLGIAGPALYCLRTEID